MAISLGEALNWACNKKRAASWSEAALLYGLGVRVPGLAVAWGRRVRPPDPPPQAANAVLASTAATGASGGMGCVLDAVPTAALAAVGLFFLCRQCAQRLLVGICHVVSNRGNALESVKHLRLLLAQFVSNRYGRYRIAPIPMRCLGPVLQRGASPSRCAYSRGLASCTAVGQSRRCLPCADYAGHAACFLQ